jgi:cellulose synthase/poly-beta-1,6-N-acetylglucosamine synthase-like glycosyltransferase
MTVLITATILASIIPLSVYLIYTVATLTSRPVSLQPINPLPDISIVIPAYNEEVVIEDRLGNLAEIYPKERMEIMVSNDGSTDNTEKIAQEALNKYSLKGKVITKPRGGVNSAINRGIQESSSEIVIITGADGLFDKDTIVHLVSILQSSEEIGAVSGDIVPRAKGETLFSKSEEAYRSIYGKICMWESKISSTYCFNGAVVAFKKKAASSLNSRRGADDASMALSVIRNGYRCIYVPTAKFYESIPHSFDEQKRQKIRRATRLLEATYFNRDVMSSKYGLFGMVVFPLRLLMFFVVPALFFISLILWIVLLWSINPWYGAGLGGFIALLLFIGSFKSNLVSSFIIYQMYLLLGLFNMMRDVHIWEPGVRNKI